MTQLSLQGLGMAQRNGVCAPFAVFLLLALAISRAATLSNSLPPMLSAPYEKRKLTDFYSIKSWRTEEGLPRNAVNCLLQTSDGYLWIGTRNGLARFDGVRFQVYERDNTPELHHNNILSLAESPPGRLWVGTMDSLTEYSNHQFFWHAIGTLSPNRIWSLAHRKAGGLWLGTENGLVLFDGCKAIGFGDRRTPLTLEYRNAGLPRQEIFQVLEDSAGLVWLYEKDLMRLQPGTEDFEVAYASNPNAPGSGPKLRLVEGADGTACVGFWFGEGAGLFICHGERIEMIAAKESGFLSVPGPLCTDANGGMWLRDGNSGLSYFQGGRFIHYRSPTGMLDDEVECLTPDREGNLWVGTVRGGLNRLQPRRLINLTTSNGLAHDSVHSISEGPDGSVWIGTQQGLSRYRDGQFTTYTSGIGTNENERLRLNGVEVVLADPNGNIFTSNGGSLSQVRSNALVPLHRQEGGTNITLAGTTIYSDRSRTLWVADGNLLFRRRGTDWEAVLGPGSEPLVFPSVVGLLEDFTGSMWVGTKSGVFRLRSGVCERFSRKEGFPADYSSAALADPDGTVWFGSDRGLIRYREGKFFLFTTAQGLFENLVLNVLEDDFGCFWLNGHQGLQQVRRADLNNVADGHASSFRAIHYGEADGMLSVEGNGGALPNSCKTRDGRLWFPTVKGVVVVDPHSLSKNAIPPPVLIEQVVANSEPVWGDTRSDIYDRPLPTARSNIKTSNAAFAQSHRLGPGGADTVLFRYTASSFMAPDKVRFQYRLQGHDPDWIEDRAKLRAAIYTNLRPGRYVFRVRAYNNHGVQSSSDAQFAFSVAPHFYETWLFYALCGCTMFLFVATLHHVRMASLRRIKELERLHALELERGRIAKDMHDSLGADLSRIAILAEVVQRQGAAGSLAQAQLERVSGLARTLVRGIGELVWATNPRNNSLESLAAYIREYASELLEAGGVQVVFQFPQTTQATTLSGEVRRHLFLAIKETLNNVAKHAGASEVVVHLAASTSEVALTIRDNGRGFQLSSNAGAGGQTNGNGLRNLRERLASIGGKAEITSELGKGTSVWLSAPLRSPTRHQAN